VVAPLRLLVAHSGRWRRRKVAEWADEKKQWILPLFSHNFLFYSDFKASKGRFVLLRFECNG